MFDIKMKDMKYIEETWCYLNGMNFTQVSLKIIENR